MEQEGTETVTTSLIPASDAASKINIGALARHGVRTNVKH
jgi:hypothetical protein